MPGGIEFDWDGENAGHLAIHKVRPSEVEQVLNNEPLDLDYEVIGGEERYRSVGFTDTGRVLLVVWTIRNCKIRAITAFPAGAAVKRAFLEKHR